jgi:hypothetical protein
LLPVDLAFVKAFVSFCPRETYYIFIRGDELVCAHFSKSIDEWGAWVLSVADVAAMGLQDHHLARSAQAERAFFDVESRFANNRSGMLAFLWQEISMLPEAEREKKVFLCDSSLISRLACILVKRGIAVEDDVAEALILRGEDVIRDSVLGPQSSKPFNSDFGGGSGGAASST